jgi:hypothetical protein
MCLAVPFAMGRYPSEKEIGGTPEKLQAPAEISVGA